VEPARDGVAVARGGHLRSGLAEEESGAWREELGERSLESGA
jgi:hypothetical protein